MTCISGENEYSGTSLSLTLTDHIFLAFFYRVFLFQRLKCIGDTCWEQNFCPYCGGFSIVSRKCLKLIVLLENIYCNEFLLECLSFDMRPKIKRCFWSCLLYSGKR